jgi:hypothetical protein
MPFSNSAMDELGDLEQGVEETMARTLPILTTRTTDEKGKVSVPPTRARINFWASPAAQRTCKHLAAVAQRLLTMHATSYASERKWSVWGRIYAKSRARLAVARAEKQCSSWPTTSCPASCPTTKQNGRSA